MMQTITTLEGTITNNPQTTVVSHRFNSCAAFILINIKTHNIAVCHVAPEAFWGGDTTIRQTKETARKFLFSGGSEFLLLIVCNSELWGSTTVFYEYLKQEIQLVCKKDFLEEKTIFPKIDFFTLSCNGSKFSVTDEETKKVVIDRNYAKVFSISWPTFDLQTKQDNAGNSSTFIEKSDLIKCFQQQLTAEELQKNYQMFCSRLNMASYDFQNKIYSGFERSGVPQIYAKAVYGFIGASVFETLSNEAKKEIINLFIYSLDPTRDLELLLTIVRIINIEKYRYFDRILERAAPDALYGCGKSLEKPIARNILKIIYPYLVPALPPMTIPVAEQDKALQTEKAPHSGEATLSLRHSVVFPVKSTCGEIASSSQTAETTVKDGSLARSCCCIS